MTQSEFEIVRQKVNAKYEGQYKLVEPRFSKLLPGLRRIKDTSDPSSIFVINVGQKRIRYITTLNLQSILS